VSAIDLWGRSRGGCLARDSWPRAFLSPPPPVDYSLSRFRSSCTEVVILYPSGSWPPSPSPFQQFFSHRPFAMPRFPIFSPFLTPTPPPQSSSFRLSRILVQRFSSFSPPPFPTNHSPPILRFPPPRRKTATRFPASF